MAELISESCELSGVLHQGQMGSRKQRSCIDAVARVVNKVEEAWGRGNIAALLLMDVKGAFDHVRCTTLQRMQEMQIDGNIIGWVESFLTDRHLQLVIDGYCGETQLVSMGVPQGSPVSPILFAIYLSGVFSELEGKVSTCVATSFADDCSFLSEAPNIIELIGLMEEAGCRAIERGERNFLQFDHDKTEAVVFTKRRKSKSEIVRVTLMIKDQIINFNKEATRWLGVWLDAALSFRTHKDVYLNKARKAEARLRSIVNRKGLAPGLSRKIQIAAV